VTNRTTCQHQEETAGDMTHKTSNPCSACKGGLTH